MTNPSAIKPWVAAANSEATFHKLTLSRATLLLMCLVGFFLPPTCAIVTVLSSPPEVGSRISSFMHPSVSNHFLCSSSSMPSNSYSRILPDTVSLNGESATNIQSWYFQFPIKSTGLQIKNPWKFKLIFQKVVAFLRYRPNPERYVHAGWMYRNCNTQSLLLETLLRCNISWIKTDIFYQNRSEIISRFFEPNMVLLPLILRVITKIHFPLTLPCAIMLYLGENNNNVFPLKAVDTIGNFSK